MTSIEGLLSGGTLRYLDDSHVLESGMLSALDDESNIVIIKDTVTNWDVDFEDCLKLGGSTKINVQSYSYSRDTAGFLSIKEDEIPPFEMYCKDYHHYYCLCNEHLHEENSDLGKEKSIIFSYLNLSSGKKEEIDIFSKAMYAIDIPLKTFPMDLDDYFKQNFKFTDTLLPSGKYCYLQFVSAN